MNNQEEERKRLEELKRIEEEDKRIREIRSTYTSINHILENTATKKLIDTSGDDNQFHKYATGEAFKSELVNEYLKDFKSIGGNVDIFSDTYKVKHTFDLLAGKDADILLMSFFNEIIQKDIRPHNAIKLEDEKLRLFASYGLLREMGFVINKGAIVVLQTDKGEDTLKVLDYEEDELKIGWFEVVKRIKELKNN